jgi:hypothetical protein
MSLKRFANNRKSEILLLRNHSSLIIVHSVAGINAEDISAGLRSCPIKIPVIICRHLIPAAFLEIIEQH